MLLRGLPTAWNFWVVLVSAATTAKNSLPFSNCGRRCTPSSALGKGAAWLAPWNICKTPNNAVQAMAKRRMALYLIGHLCLRSTVKGIRSGGNLQPVRLRLSFGLRRYPAALFLVLALDCGALPPLFCFWFWLWTAALSRRFFVFGFGSGL